MFGKKTANGYSEEKDLQLLMQAMDGVIGGNYEDIDTSAFQNPAYGEKFNELMHAYKRSNNNFVMRLNQAMGSIGDNSYVKKTLDQVQSQTESIRDMENASRDMETSINNISEAMSHIRENTHDVIATADSSTENMNNSIQVVNESSEKIQAINEQVQEFQGKIDKIGEIVDVVKKVASQSNLLALNASIEAARAGEAGKGFAVVADQIRSLSSGTQDSSNSIMEALSHLEATSDEMLESITETVELIQLNIEKVSTVNKSVSDITSDATSLGDNIKVVDSAVKQVENSNETLTANMNQVGEIMQIMTESINNAEQTTKTMLSKYEASAKSATDIESVVGELMEELGIGGFMNVSDIKSGMKFRMVIEDQTNAKEEYTGEVVDRKDNNVYININNRAAFDDKRRNLKCSFNAVVDNVLYCWNGIAIHNVKAGEKGQFKLTIDTNPQVYNRRKYPRMPLDNKCTISVDGTDITYYGHMVNISANGFAFSVNDSSFENMKGKNIVIEIDNFDVIKDKEIQGCIIRCSNDEGNYIVGCRMPEDSNEIKDYVNKNYSE